MLLICDHSWVDYYLPVHYDYMKKYCCTKTHDITTVTVTQHSLGRSLSCQSIATNGRAFWPE